MKILMVYPESPSTFWAFQYALRFIHKRANLPPLGLLTIAAMLPRDWDIRLVDMNVEKLSDSQIKKADYVMISAMSVQRDSAEKVIARCKNLGKKVICGGPLFSSEPQNFEQVDHLLLFEGEECVPEFLKDLKLGQAKHIYDKHTFPELSATPVPRWDLIKKDAYQMLSVQFSRGCPYNCEFCEVSLLFGKKFRTKTLPQIIAELDAIYQTGWRSDVAFSDDNFIGNKAILKKEILPGMIEWMKSHGYPFHFFTEVSINVADDDELMDMMVQAGFENIFIGIESVDDSCLEECGKVQNRSRDTMACIKKIQKRGLQVYGGFILGFDNDKPDVFEKMYRFIQDSGIVNAMISLLTAIPGTELYRRMEKENRIIGLRSDDMTSTNIVTKMDRAILKNGYIRLMSDIYAPENFYERIRTFFENYQYPGLHHNKIGFAEVSAFLKVCYLMGIRDKRRKHFWSLLSWTFKQRKKAPWMFSGAIIFSVFGYHFRKLIENDIAPN